MPEFLRLLARHQRQMRYASVGLACLAGLAAAALIAIAVVIAGSAPSLVRALAAIVFIVVTAGAASIWWRRWSTARVAAAIEQHVPFDNLVVTAEEIASGRHRDVHPILVEELLRKATDRLQSVTPAAIQPLTRLSLLCAAAAAATIVLLAMAPTRPSIATIERGAGSDRAMAPAAGDLRVTVVPPSYANRPAVSEINPSTVTALEGSRIRLDVPWRHGRIQLRAFDGLPVPSFARRDEEWSAEFIATGTRALVMEFANGSAGAGASRLLQLRVEPDRRPLVRIRAPATDLVFGAPRGRVPLEIEARDDVGLSSLQLRYTRVSGSGESFTFAEGEWPITIARHGTGQWDASGSISLDDLKLSDGDTIVYRAVATERKPGSDPVASESYLIEIGRLGGVASTGFAVDEERDRQAISQQMLIIKTERLHNERGRMSADAVLEQSRLLAVEQRMVRAEFVFMTGGEVADEVEEATHAHELAEGRLENEAQTELLNAIREMSRAEARLNAADTAPALEFERAALKALQRAFDRRRYLLRTLPERTRIDTARRLTGDLSQAGSTTQPSPSHVEDEVVTRARTVLIQLGELTRTPERVDAALAAALAQVDPSSDRLQQAAAQLLAAASDEARRAHAADAARLLIEIVQGRVARGAQGRIDADPLGGRLADQLRTLRGPR